MPSSSRTFATAPISESVFFRGKAKSSLASFQSGRIELKILLCFTCPAITARFTPSLCISSIALLSSPRLTQCSRFEIFSSSGEASSFRAITAISMPWLRAPSRTRKGNLPFPAIRPQPVVLSIVSGMKFRSVLLHDAAFGLFHEFHQLLHVGGIRHALSNLCERLRSVFLRARQHAKRFLQRLDALGGKSLALQPDRVRAKAPRLPLGDDQRKRRHVLGNHRRRADIRVAAQAAKLVHRRKRAQRYEILYGHVTRQRSAVHEQRIVADLAVVPDVRVRKKKIVIANPRDTAALRGSPADGYMLAKNVCTAHLQFDALATESVVLRIAANHAKRVKHVVICEFRRAAHHRMLVQYGPVAQFHVRADHRIRANPHARAQLRFL